MGYWIALEPRTGAIQTGNGLSNTGFAVFQGGACTYSLSSNLIVLQPGGGMATVSVTTETGCVWVRCSERELAYNNVWSERYGFRHRLGVIYVHCRPRQQ